MSKSQPLLTPFRSSPGWQSRDPVGMRQVPAGNYEVWHCTPISFWFPRRRVSPPIISTLHPMTELWGSFRLSISPWWFPRTSWRILWRLVILVKLMYAFFVHAACARRCKASIYSFNVSNASNGAHYKFTASWLTTTDSNTIARHDPIQPTQDYGLLR